MLVNCFMLVNCPKQSMRSKAHRECIHYGRYRQQIQNLISFYYLHGMLSYLLLHVLVCSYRSPITLTNQITYKNVAPFIHLYFS